MTPEPASGTPDRLTIQAEAVLFGFPSSTVVVGIRPRTLGWRAGGAARTLAIFLVVTPVVAVVPPHAPWAIGALVTGVVMARRRWSERLTLESGRGPCPKCGGPLAVKPGRLRVPHPVSCEGCHHESSLRIGPDQLSRLLSQAT